MSVLEGRGMSHPAHTTRFHTHGAATKDWSKMEDYFMDVPIFDSFDAVAHVSDTRCTEYVAEPMAS
jgi:erythromycin esterase